MISGEVVSRISTATDSRRRALKDTPSPRPSFRSWCSSIRVYCRVEPYMLTQAGPRVGRNPGGDHFSSQVELGFYWNLLSFFGNQSANPPIESLYFVEMIIFIANESGCRDCSPTTTQEVDQLNEAASFLFKTASIVVFSLTFVAIV